MINRPMQIQIGKNGLTDGVIDSFKTAFESHNSLRISVLKAARKENQTMHQMADEIVSRLEEKGQRSASRVIGFTIILSKLGKKK